MVSDHCSTLPGSSGLATPHGHFVQLPLFNPIDEASLYLPQNGGYFSLLVRGEEGKILQHSYPVKELARVLSLIDVGRDTWISQAQFWTTLRRVVNVKSISTAFLDIDSYKGYEWAVGRNPEQLSDCFMSFCDDEGIPRPSITNFSGQGLQPKWLFASALPRAALPRWNALEKHLVKKFDQYGADPHAKDAARVLRVTQTVSSKSGKVCRTVGMTAGDDGKPLVYDFDELCEYILPLSRAELEERRHYAATKGVKVLRKDNGFSLQTLNWSRLEDLRMLLKLRGGIDEGQRMEMLFYMMNFLALSGQVTLATFYREASFIAAEIDPMWTFRSAELRTVYAKFQAAMRGEKISLNGYEFTPLYTPKTETLVDLFQVTDEEMIHMKTLISEDVRRERHRISEMNARRAAGAIPRADYEGRADARAERARELRCQGVKVSEIAKVMGLSRMQVYRYLNV